MIEVDAMAWVAVCAYARKKLERQALLSQLDMAHGMLEEDAVERKALTDYVGDIHAASVAAALTLRADQVLAAINLMPLVKP